MSHYTELLNIQAETLSPDDDNYEEILLETAKMFRGFGSALTSFLQEHGYVGEITDIDAKAEFLRDKFRTAGIAPPRDFKKWFLPDYGVKRSTAYKICFAFSLDTEATKNFFKCIQFERGFDCHTINEAVYYFCIKNSLPYTDAETIIAKIPIPQKYKSLPNQEILYTCTIIENINGIDSKENLIKYITDNIHDFRYNNATAIKYIQGLWNDISKENGLAIQEGLIIDKYNQFEDRRKKSIADTRSAKVVADEVCYQEKDVKSADFVVATAASSTWTIFSQILGLDNYLESKYQQKKFDRSINTVLSENKLMPLKASYCFPSRQNIDALIRGDLVKDDETIRKMLIFLIFYSYWAKIIISKNDAQYFAKKTDSNGCLYRINNYLLDAGYPELYSGNPFDWLFMWSLYDDHPLQAFRIYMGEVFAVKEDAAESE